MSTMIGVKPPTAPELVEFTAHDRCDRCGAQAYHVSRKGFMDLLWCNHHHNKHEDKLLSTGWTVISDQEAIDRLTQQPG